MLGIKNTFDHVRCMAFTRVLPVDGQLQICHRNKVSILSRMACFYLYFIFSILPLIQLDRHANTGVGVGTHEMGNFHSAL